MLAKEYVPSQVSWRLEGFHYGNDGWHRMAYARRQPP